MKKILFPVLFFCFFLNAVCSADVPAEHTQAINTALMEVLNVDKPDAIEHLKGGFSSPGLYKITVDSKTFVVRFSNKDRTLEEREGEFDAMRISADRGSAPKIIYCKPSEGITIMEFIVSLNKSENFNPLSVVNLKLLASGIRKIHEGPTFKKGISQFQMARFYESGIKREKPSIIPQALNLLNKLEMDLKDVMINKPCHNDLNPNNLLYTKDKIYFIDWEVAGQSEPFFDLATPDVLFNMNEQQEKTYLKAYFERDPLPEELAKYKKMKQAALIYYGFALVWVSQDRGAGMLSEEDVEALPPLEVFLQKTDNLDNPEKIQKFAFAFLRKAMKDKIQSSL